MQQSRKCWVSLTSFYGNCSQCKFCLCIFFWWILIYYWQYQGFFCRVFVVEQRVSFCPQSCERESSFSVHISLALDCSILQCSCSISVHHHSSKMATCCNFSGSCNVKIIYLVVKVSNNKYMLISQYKAVSRTKKILYYQPWHCNMEERWPTLILPQSACF